MNIPQPPDRPVFWSVLYEDGTTTSSEEQTWNEQAHPRTEEDGTLLFWSSKPVTSLSVEYQDQRLSCRPLVPCPFFAFARYASTPSESYWLYTQFGYALDDYRVLLTVHALGMFHTTVEPRSLPLLHVL